MTDQPEDESLATQSESAVDAEAPRKVPGTSEVLAQAREKLGLSQKDVADKLYLTTTFIRYIDDGEFERIPKPAFIKGYLRSYARVVELSGDEIVALYEAEMQATEPTPEIRGVTEEKVGSSSITGPVLQTGLIGLVSLVAVIALMWWLVADREEPRQPVITQPGLPGPAVQDAESADADFGYVLEDVRETDQVDESAESLAESAVLSSADEPQQGEAEALVDETGDQPVPDDTTELNEAATSVSAEVPGDPESTESVKFERIVDGERSFITLDAGGFDQIELSFRDECWVEVTDGREGLIYNDLNRVGDLLTVYGTPPFKVLLGKATDVEMIYNGRPFDLEPFIAQDKTAKLTISE